MKITRGILAAMLLFFSVVFFPIDSAFGAEESFEKQVACSNEGQIYLQNVSGDIRISSWERNEVRVEAVKIARFRRNLDDITIEVTQSGNAVRIRTRHHQGFKWFWSGHITVDYHLTVPQGAAVETETVSGDSVLENIGGILEAKSVSGELQIKMAGNGVRAHSVSGDISLTDISGDTVVNTTSGRIDIDGIRGSVEAESVSGDIDVARHSDARKIRFETISGSITLKSEDETMDSDNGYRVAGRSVSGDIDLIDIFGAREIELETLSGDISMRGSLLPNGSYLFDSHSGQVQLILPEDSAFDLRAKVTSGSIECDFDMMLNGKNNAKKVHAMIGNGGAGLDVSTFSGDVQIRKR